MSFCCMFLAKMIIKMVVRLSSRGLVETRLWYKLEKYMICNNGLWELYAMTMMA